MRLGCFMKKIIQTIKDWYRGDDGEPEFNFVTQEYEYKRAPKRHWLAIIISKPVGLFKTILLAIRRNLNTFTTQFFAFLIVILTAGSFYYQYHINNQKHERCPETQADKKSVNIECGK